MQIPLDMLGFRGDPKWRDMSDYLVHFTSEAGLNGILDAKAVEARGEFGWFRSDAQTSALRRSACFSEIPIDQIDRLASRRGHFGIGFRRSFVQAHGGARVWYAESPQSDLLFAAFGRIRAEDSGRTHPMWRLTPFIDYVSSGYNFVWEREWRVPGGLPFELGDVQFLVVPRGSDKTMFRNPAPGVPLLSADAMEFWTDAFAALGGPQDRYIDQFLRAYANPLDHLTWDSEGGDYVWIVDEYETEDAVANLFGDLDDDALEQLAHRLNEIAPSWIDRDELARISE